MVASHSNLLRVIGDHGNRPSLVNAVAQFPEEPRGSAGVGQGELCEQRGGAGGGAQQGGAAPGVIQGGMDSQGIQHGWNILIKKWWFE